MADKNLFTQVLTSEAKALEACALNVKESEIQKLLKIFDHLKSNRGNLIFSGVGKSGHIAQKIAATFSSLGLPAFFLHPIEAMHGDLGRVTKDDAIVLISKSGTTDELLSLIPYLQIPFERRIAILGRVPSPISEMAGVVFDGQVEKEACLNDLAPTTSTTVALALGDAMAVLYENHVGLSKEGFALNHPAGLLGKTLSLKIEQIMILAKDCPMVSPQATLQEVILEMTKKPVGMCAVIDQGKLQGLFVEGDIRRAFTKGASALEAKVKDLMNAKPVTLEPQMLAYEALKVMENPQRVLNVAPVLKSGEFCGVIRLHDLFKAGFQSSLR